MDMRALERFHRWHAISNSTYEQSCELTTCEPSRMNRVLRIPPSIRRTWHLLQTMQARAAANRQRARESRNEVEGGPRVDDDRRSSFARRIFRQLSREWAAGAGARDRDSGPADAKGGIQAMRAPGKERAVGDLPDTRRAELLFAQARSSCRLYSVRFGQQAKYRVPHRA